MSQYKDYRKATPKQIRIIKMAQRELDISDNDYRTMLWKDYGVSSSTKLMIGEAEDLINRFVKWGFVIISPKGKPSTSGSDPSRKRQIDKIGALLTAGQRPWSYADALAKAICRNEDGQPIERLKFVPTDQLRRIIGALEKQAEREGWND